jgi:UDP-N-acetylglucosamine:LPS N-acetylglucosamine transferase
MATDSSRRAPPATKAQRLALHAALGAVQDRFLVMLTGGAAGAGLLYPRTMALLRPFPAVTACGRNEQLRRRLTLESWRYGDRLLPLGFVSKMADWLRCADAVITKAPGPARSR